MAATAERAPAVKRRISAEQRRAQLVEVSLQLFAERGYDGAATRDIAAAAGVAEALLFRHFATKRDILRAVIREYGPKSQILRLAPQIADLPTREALTLIYSQRVEALWNNRLFVRLVMTESKKEGEASDEFRAMLEEAPQLTAEFLRVRIAAGELRSLDADLAAAMLGGAVFGCFMRHQRLPPEEGLPICRAFAAGCVNLFLDTAFPTPSPGGRADSAGREP